METFDTISNTNIDTWRLQITSPSRSEGSHTTYRTSMFWYIETYDTIANTSSDTIVTSDQLLLGVLRPPLELLYVPCRVARLFFAGVFFFQLARRSFSALANLWGQFCQRLSLERSLLNAWCVARALLQYLSTWFVCNIWVQDSSPRFERVALRGKLTRRFVLDIFYVRLYQIN